MAVALPEGRLVARAERPTRPERGPEAVALDLAELLSEAALGAERLGLDASTIPAVVATTGPIDADGAFVDPSNLGPAFRGFPLRRRVVEHLGRSVRLAQDTHVALLGEWTAGALRGIRDGWYITVSTGVGGAQLVDGHLVTGADRVAGEVGHLWVQAGGPRCGCGARGHLEAVASGPAIALAGQTAARAGRSPALAALGRVVTAEDVSSAAEAGDRGAARVLAAARAALGRAVAGLVNIGNPERIVLGGGVLLADPGPWLDACATELRRGGVEQARSRVELRVAALGQDAGLLGCLAYEAAGH